MGCAPLTLPGLALAHAQLANVGGSDVDVFRFPQQACKGVAKLITVKDISPVKKATNANETGQKREIEWERAAVKEALGAPSTVKVADRQRLSSMSRRALRSLSARMTRGMPS